LILSTSDFGPRHVALPRIFANPKESQPAEITHCFFGHTLRKAAGKSTELYRYDAEHAFVNEQRMSVHDRAAAQLAWGRATDFFRKHLG
jgi:carboxymethylenebutenolidase